MHEKNCYFGFEEAVRRGSRLMSASQATNGFDTAHPQQNEKETTSIIAQFSSKLRNFLPGSTLAINPAMLGRGEYCDNNQYLRSCSQ